MNEISRAPHNYFLYKIYVTAYYSSFAATPSAKQGSFRTADSTIKYKAYILARMQ